jgi:hypothetical protein
MKKPTKAELIDILKTDMDMISKSLNGLTKRFDVKGDLEFEDARGWLTHALDVIRYWEKQK